MLGIDPMTQRDRMAEGIDVILRLFRDETVTEKTDWYTLVNARLHLPPYTKPHPEMAVVSAVTPSGGRLAGQIRSRHDLRRRDQPVRLRRTWRATGRSPATSPPSTAARWTRRGCAWSGRCTSPRPAKRRSRTPASASKRYLNYLNNNQRRFVVPAGEDPLEWFVENSYGVVGTPDDAIALIERLQEKQGEFGVFLQQAHNWADWEETKRSYELYARYVMPHFSRDNRPRAESYDWCTEHRDELSEKRSAAARAMFDKHEAEQRAARTSQETLDEAGRRAAARHGNVASKRCIIRLGSEEAAMASERAAGYRKGLVDLAAGQISREIFVNDEIYREEQERVFARSWLFVGHESQIPNPGDFFVSAMGEESVILCRDRAGQIHVFLNSCRHRGMKVCRYDEGNTAVFTCPYHGWSYSTDGRLVGVPYFREAYHSKLDRAQWGLVEVAQLCNYKGSVWATWDPAAPSFLEYLGEFATLSRPDPRRPGRARGPGRGAGRRAEMADPVQLEIPGGEFQRRQLPQHQPPLGRSGRHRPERRRPARHGRAD